MSVYNGKLHETTIKFPNTHIWMDSCGIEELKYGIEHGCTSATSNPIIIAAVVRKEWDYWSPYIQQLIRDNPTFSEDDITWALIDEVCRQRSQLLLSIFKANMGKKGRLSVQTNAKNYRSTQRMTEQAIHLNSLSENMQIKLPASVAGIAAMEEATYQGISINATVSFTVAQAIAVAEAVERGLARRKAAGKDCSMLAPVCTLMVGRVDDWVKQSVATAGLVVNPECLEWGGVAVFKAAYHIYDECGYSTRLLGAANRNHYHWSELIGGNVAQTINFSWQKKLEHCNVEVTDRINKPIKPEYLEELMTLPEFIKGYTPDAQTPEDFEHYGAFCDTLNTFIAGYDDFAALIRRSMITTSRR